MSSPGEVFDLYDDFSDIDYTREKWGTDGVRLLDIYNSAIRLYKAGINTQQRFPLKNRIIESN